MSLRRHFLLLFVLGFCLLACTSVFAQTETATLSGLITDPQGRPVPGVEVTVTNQDTNVSVQRTTNDAGLYVAFGLKPGRYRVSITKEGFRKIDLIDLVLNVQDVLSRNLQLQLGPVTTSITVVAEETKVNTTAAVSTVVDRQFVENLPLNGRSFQNLIALTPGAVITPSEFFEPGQFSFNGQRPSANYFTVDGVSANIGISPGFSQNQSSAGATPGFNTLGGTNSLVSIDGMQEFRIQTSTFAPEFGRVPGAQISIVTRSGTNTFHGTLYDYFRNDVLDANDWFSNRANLPKSEERQNDFGGVFGGPIWKDRTFFFFSYEGLRLRIPNTITTFVPGANARATAPVAIQPFLAVYPQPTGPDDLATNTAPFTSGFSDPASIDAFSLRLDQVVNSKLTLFARYNCSPSETGVRAVGAPPNVIFLTRSKIQTLTAGATWSATARVVNDFRFNYSHNATSSGSDTDTLGGAALPPPDSALFPSPFTSSDSQYGFSIFSLAPSTGWRVGRSSKNVQRQINAVDSISWQKGTHSLKFGVDYRRLMPIQNEAQYVQGVFFLDVNSALALTPFFAVITDTLPSRLGFQNLGLFAQDTWRVAPRLTFTYGVRWDIDFAPHTTDGPDLLAVNQVSDLPNVAVAPPGTPVFKTRYSNFAPRLGVAYNLFPRQNWNTVVRGGFGVFYDLSSQEVSQAISTTFPYGASKFVFGGLTFPLDPATAAPPPIVPDFASNGLTAADPHLNLPYSLQWNVSVEQALGKDQLLSATYVAQVGRRLIQTELDFPVNANIIFGHFYRNRATSDYHALQLQFQRKLSRGLQALAGYTFSHSIDTASSNSGQLNSGTGSLFVVGGNSRGNSDFDIRHTFNAALSYEIPGPRRNAVARAILGRWAVDNLFAARSAPPVDILDNRFGFLNGGLGAIRPDVVPGQPLVISDPTVAGGQRFNPAAFADAPFGQQGTLPRNFLRAFGAWQWDLAVRRRFTIREPVSLQFRAEFFNVLNHPNFAPPNNDFSAAFPNPLFGQATQMLSRNLGGAGAGLSPLYQIGGPRSVQLALKLEF